MMTPSTTTVETPRFIISAVGGDGGKTLLSIGAAAALRARGLVVAPFKKGPDYIDAAWLRRASGLPARNLDTFIQDGERMLTTFARALRRVDVGVIEGNRGLYDGLDAEGTHSTAALARRLATPVVVVLDTTKVTRTVAAVALGCQRLEPETPLAGFVLNRVATARQESVIRQAVETATGIPVVGAIRRHRGEVVLPDRHLGLVTPEEHEHADRAIAQARAMIEADVDLDRLVEIAERARPIEAPHLEVSRDRAQPVVIGVVRDSAFSFYYPENLEALQRAGASLVEISTFDSRPLPGDLDALYIGGGFPETHAAEIAENEILLSSLKSAADAGLPIYAECGGLMLLARALSWREHTYSMAGVFPVDVVVKRRPVGHGYCVVEAVTGNPFFDCGTVLRGHEFHYSTVVAPADLPTGFRVRRGVGCFDNTDGLIYKNVLASYAHLHALGDPSWCQGVIRRARRFRRKRSASREPGEAHE